ncbi:MAG: winged helix-turn-helix domain-containing protein, partial [Rubrivivax sp.]|nr:winged helix-turn-helix domain-containing protein [Rubrivivax sp.]
RFQPSAESSCCGIVKMGERKRDIASQLAITPETLSRLMRSFSRQGLLSVTGYTVHVADVQGLRRIAEGG